MADREDEAGPGDEPAPESNADAATVKRRTKAAKAKAELRRRLLGQFLASRDARDWLYDILARCHLYAPSHVAGDPCSTAFQEGERNIGLMLLAEIPTKVYALMIEEHSDG